MVRMPDNSPVKIVIDYNPVGRDGSTRWKVTFAAYVGCRAGGRHSWTE